MTYDMPVAIAPYRIIYDEFGDAAGSNLGALVADAIYHYVNSEGPGTDIAIVAAGVLRDPIQPGVQSVADIFRAMSLGSGNDLVPGYPLSKLWVTGKELKEYYGDPSIYVSLGAIQFSLLFSPPYRI